MDKKKYRSRHERSDNPPNRRFLESDLEIVKAVAEFRLINSHQLQRLMRRGQWNFKKRLQFLWQVGFLDRLEGPLAEAVVYSLGPLGLQLLEDTRSGFDRSKIEELKTQRRVRQDRNNVGNFFTDHQLLIGDIRIGLSLLPEDSGVELTDWKPEGKQIQDTVRVPSPDGASSQVRFINPDGLAELRVDNKERPYRHFFVEADTGSETVKSLSGHRDYFRKLPAYLEWFRGNGHKRLLGIDSFQVLTITTSEKRALNLAETAKLADPRGRGSLLFLFGCVHDFLDNPSALLGDMWLMPQDDKKHKLLGP